MNILDHFTEWSLFEASAAPVAGAWMLSRRYRRAVKTRGSAKWLPLWRASNYGLLRGPGVIIGDWSRWTLLPVFYRGNSNILTVGPPGSMKGVGMLIPNALRWPFMFLYDPGGEISAVCASEWKRQGHVIHSINPWGMHGLPTGGFNPLDRLDPKSETFSSDALLLASNLVERSKNPDHWEKKGFGAYQKLLMHNKLTEKPEHQNLARVRQYVNGSIQDWSNLIEDLQESKNEAVRGLGNEWQRMASTPKEFSGIISTMESATMWLDDPVMKRAVKQSTRFEDLKGTDKAGKKLKGCIVLVIIPLAFKDSHAPFVCLAIASSLIGMQQGEVAADRPKMLMMLDEFASLGRIDMVVDGLATLRKYRVWLHLVIQNIGQMKDIYQQGWSKIEGGCEVRQYLASWDGETAEHVSKACGTSTVEEEVDGKKVMVARRMVMPEEVTQLRQDHQLVFIGNLQPARLKIRPYWQRPELRGKFSDNPYHGKTPGRQITWPLQWVAGLTFRLFAGLKGPLAIIAALMMLALLSGWQ